MRPQKFFLMTIIALAISQVDKISQATEVTAQTLNISGRRVSSDKTGSQYLAMGGARAFIEGEKAAVDADEISYNELTGIMDVRGHVHFIRNGMLTTGEEFKFRVRSKDYLITEPSKSASTKPLTTKLSVTDVSIDVQKHRDDNPEI
ncbi:MAG: hypothetical protein P4L53_01370 [Candidatus Obscuribacterales bacterium]|nr:hypothetical protein [Candidatus Obscuribacterales bacterium]